MTSAVFHDDTLVLASGGQVLLHHYTNSTSITSTAAVGVTDLVTSPCCDVTSPWCAARNHVILAYARATPTSHVMLSRDGGGTFVVTSLGGVSIFNHFSNQSHFRPHQKFSKK